MFTLSSLLLGVGAYGATELFSWLNKLGTGTPFEGKTAWLTVAVGSLIVAFVKEFFFSHVALTDYQSFLTAAGTAYVWSQAYFTTAEVFFGKLLQVQPAAQQG